MIHFIDKNLYEDGKYIKVAIYYTDNYDEAVALMKKMIQNEKVDYMKMSKNETMVDILKWNNRIGIHLIPLNDNSRGHKQEYSFLPMSVVEGNHESTFYLRVLSSTVNYSSKFEVVKDSYVPRLFLY